MKFTVMLAVVAIGLLSHCAKAAQTSGWQVTLSRGSANTLVKVYTGATREAAEQACVAAVPQANATSITYTCSAAKRVFVVTPDQVTSKLLSWTPPGQNSDGSTLTNLAGYRIHYGRNPTELVQVIQLAVPGASSYRITSLTSGTWYFGIRAYNSAGTESELSAVISAVVP